MVFEILTWTHQCKIVMSEGQFIIDLVEPTSLGWPVKQHRTHNMCKTISIWLLSYLPKHIFIEQPLKLRFVRCTHSDQSQLLIRNPLCLTYALINRKVSIIEGMNILNTLSLNLCDFLNLKCVLTMWRGTICRGLIISRTKELCTKPLPCSSINILLDTIHSLFVEFFHPFLLQTLSIHPF